ncbi:MAG: gliding motility-associated C-terminal domain-containing protein [Bacteroidia bacterium]|nr:gliding motility-associated C-terminal domain-containing protein [Bacteroidia bacterium]
MKKLFVFVLVCASFFAKSQQQVCAGSSTTLTATTPASITAPTYSMLTPPTGTFSSVGGTFVVSPTVTTTYTLITKDANSTASLVVVKTVTVFAQPVVAPSYTQTSCTSTVNGMNLNLSFSPASPTPTYSMAWAATTGTIPNIPGCITSPTQYSCMGGITAGPYQTTITSAGGCSVVVAFTINPIPAPANFSLIPGGTSFSITCYTPSVSLSTNNANYTYTWSSNTLGSIVSNTILLTSANQGSTTIAATNPASGCTSTKTISIMVNTVIPQANITPTIQNITCNLTSITTVTMTALSPTVNITHVINPPQGGAYTANTFTAAYAPQGGTGTYSYCLLDNSNGCSTCKNFTVNSSQGYPVFSLQSTPPGFTVGCNSKSVTTVNIFSASTQPIPGGPISYTFLPPGGSTVTPPGALSSISQLTISTPGTWTVITKDNTTFCESRIPLSITQNTFGPKLDSVLVNFRILDCNNPTTTLQAISETPNISYDWAYVGVPGHLPTSTMVVGTNSATPNSTLAGTYTITLTDNDNTCRTTSIVTIAQNIKIPIVQITAATTSITCLTPTIQLTNTSPTPSYNPPFVASQGVQGFYWQGPSPQEPLSVSTTYTAQTAGTYSLIGKDLNNGCLGYTTSVLITDKRDYTTVNKPASDTIVDCGAKQLIINPIYSGTVAPMSYAWVPSNDAGPIGPSNQPSLSVSTKGTYTLTVTNGYGCATKFTIPISQATLTGAVSSDKIFGYAPLPVSFYNNSYSGNNQTNSIVTVWSFGNGGTLTTQSSSVVASTIYNAPGVYTVTAFVTKSPCTAIVTKTVTVELPPKLEIPNVFTPNGDNINDNFFLHTANLSTISIKIYDRWGHKVYDLESEKGNILWDGKNQLGIDCPEGTYFYVLKATGKDGISSWDTKGNISLFR